MVPDRHGRARRQDRQGRRSGRADPAGIRGRHQRPVPGPVAQARHQARSVHPYDGCRSQGPRAGVPPEGVRQRRHLFRRARRALLHGLRAFLHRKGTGKRPVPAEPDQAGLHSGEELLLPHVQVPAVACRAYPRKSRLHPSRALPQRSAVDDRKRRAGRPVHFASENPPRMGHRVAVRQGLRLLRVV